MLRAQSNTPSKTSDKTQNLTPESRQQGYAVSFAPVLNWGDGWDPVSQKTDFWLR
jgi:hypothetical protein